MKSFSDDADKKHGSVFVKVQSTNNKVQSTKYKVQITKYKVQSTNNVSASADSNNWTLNFELWIGGFCFELCRFIKAEWYYRIANKNAFAFLSKYKVQITKYK